MQVLLLYFSGHGVRVRGQQHAIGCDSRLSNVNITFVHTLKEKLKSGVVILLMEACGDSVHMHRTEDTMHLVRGVGGKG